MIKEYFQYDPESGSIFWLKSPSSRVTKGQPVKSKSSNGYIRVSLNKREYLAHRLAWYLYYGEWPKGVIDHINRDKTDNRIKNLRDVTQRINCQNKKDFNFGTYKVGGKYVAQFHLEGATTHIGTFDSELDAQQAYREKVGEQNG